MSLTYKWDFIIGAFPSSAEHGHLPNWVWPEFKIFRHLSQTPEILSLPENAGDAALSGPQAEHCIFRRL
jgi:hypothetical protein